MANRNLFQSIRGAFIPGTDTVNSEGAQAYAYGPEHALAQFAATGCLNSTFYASNADQLAAVLAMAEKVKPEFVARTAIYCRQKGHMKDMPALLCAWLAAGNPDLLKKTFTRVIDNGRMLRNFVQIVRSGKTGRKSLGTVPKRLVQQWLEKAGDQALFRASVGNDPSLADIIKMVHPKPAGKTREALYGYILGKKSNSESLPVLVQEYEAFRKGLSKKVPDVPFEMLTALEPGAEEWCEIARNASWQMTRMNLNTFARHGVFSRSDMTAMIANRLADRELVLKARVFPYQLMVAYVQADQSVPAKVRDSLQDAMETALENVPQLQGTVYVCPDVSGSMSSPVTGVRKGSTTAVRCIDVAGLMAAAVLRRNPDAEIIPFAEQVVDIRLNPRDSVITNAQKLAAIGGGGTNCSAPLAMLNRRKAKGDLVLFVSDNESWVDNWKNQNGTGLMREWTVFRERNPGARLVCIDIQPNSTTQARERKDILNVGGFSDQVFEILHLFAKGELNPLHWVDVIEKVEL